MNDYIKEIEEIAEKCTTSQSDGYSQIMRICEAKMAEELEEMTIDEAIAKYKETKFVRLAEWLEELKSYRLHIFGGYMTQTMLKEQYNKAIDDFVKLAKEHDFKYGKKDITKCVIGFIEFFADKLKEK